MYIERMFLKAVVHTEWLSQVNKDPKAKPNIDEHLKFTTATLASYDQEVADGKLSRIFVPEMADEVIKLPEIQSIGITFLPDAKLAIIEAKNFALKLRHQLVEPEDLLLGLAKSESEFLPGDVYKNLFKAVEGTNGNGRIINPIVFSYSKPVIFAIKYAAGVLDGRNWGSIGAGGLLLGLLETNPSGGSVYNLIRSVGKDPDLLKHAVNEKFPPWPKANTGKV